VELRKAQKKTGAMMPCLGLGILVQEALAVRMQTAVEWTGKLAECALQLGGILLKEGMSLFLDSASPRCRHRPVTILPAGLGARLLRLGLGWKICTRAEVGLEVGGAASIMVEGMGKIEIGIMGIVVGEGVEMEGVEAGEVVVGINAHTRLPSYWSLLLFLFSIKSCNPNSVAYSCLCPILNISGLETRRRTIYLPRL
jgi:hypothetical protein